jgi:hypothetical protein
MFSIEKHGTGSMLMKVTSKRRRTKEEILDQKVQELKKKTEIDKKLRDYDSML